MEASCSSFCQVCILYPGFLPAELLPFLLDGPSGRPFSEDPLKKNTSGMLQCSAT
jgi:hypothetical protein